MQKPQLIIITDLIQPNLTVPANLNISCEIAPTVEICGRANATGTPIVFLPFFSDLEIRQLRHVAQCYVCGQHSTRAVSVREGHFAALDCDRLACHSDLGFFADVLG